MTPEELKQLLDEGKIAQEQYESMVSALDARGKLEEIEAQKADEKPDGDLEAPEDIQRMIQRAVDRAVEPLGKENKSLKEKLKVYERERMTTEQARQAEIKEQEEEIAEREKAITERENRLYIVKAMKEIGLDDGDDSSLVLIDLALADTQDEIDERLKKLKHWHETRKKREVNEIFKENGRNPAKGGGAHEVNPYKEGPDFNLTKQAELEKENPELAQQLMAAAGK